MSEESSQKEQRTGAPARTLQLPSLPTGKIKERRWLEPSVCEGSLSQRQEVRKVKEERFRKQGGNF